MSPTLGFHPAETAGRGSSGYLDSWRVASHAEDHDHSLDPGRPLLTNSDAQTRVRVRDPRILWIDDEVRSDDALVRWLELDGFRVDCAVCGEEGLAKSSTRQHDVIILDLRLPDTDGIEVLERLRDARLTTPVLVLTGFGDVESAVTAMRLGAADFRRKPIDGEVLSAAIAAMLRDRIGSMGKVHASDGVRSWVPDLSPQTTRALYAFADRGGTRAALMTVLASALAEHALAIPLFLACAHALRDVVSAPPEMPTTTLAADVLSLVEDGRRLSLQCRHGKVDDAIDRLESSISSHTRLDETAVGDGVAVDPAHLGRMMFADTGLGFREWRRALTMQAAIRRMTTAVGHVAQVAYDVGFAHPNQFSREFRSLFGLTPRQLWPLVVKKDTSRS